ncbi:hypothetical protein TREES_T100009868 [Tupaia chinensis]|uniref:Uncharacterized protein n=1 Tax=Tupaia chinensis TaxID=246437 RepID=L9KQB5_TUPCH|nr:hypothetical protein TREES_T100009868 [Tupaia chinensis]
MSPAGRRTQGCWGSPGERLCGRDGAASTDKEPVSILLPSQSLAPVSWVGDGVEKVSPVPGHSSVDGALDWEAGGLDAGPDWLCNLAISGPHLPGTLDQKLSSDRSVTWCPLPRLLEPQELPWHPFLIQERCLDSEPQSENLCNGPVR